MIINNNISNQSAQTATIDKAILKNLLTQICYVVPKKAAFAALESMKLKFSPNKLVISGCDMDIEFSYQIDAQCDFNATLSIPAHSLKAALAAIKSKTICLSPAVNDLLVINPDNGSTKRLKGIDADISNELVIDYAALDSRYDVQADDFTKAINAVKPAMSNEETRYYLNGIYFHFDDHLSLVATDGRRLHKWEILETTNPLGENENNHIVPRKTVELVARLLKAKYIEKTETISIQNNASKIVISSGRFTVRSKLVDGTFPDYSRVIPHHMHDHTLTVPADTAAQGVKEVMAMLDRGTKCVTVSCGDGFANVSGQSDDNGLTAVQFNDTSYEGADDIYIGLNGAYLCDMLAAAGDNDVRFGINDANSPMRLHCDALPEFTAVLMPIRVNHNFALVTPQTIERFNANDWDKFTAGYEHQCKLVRQAAMTEDKKSLNAMIRAAMTEDKQVLGAMMRAAIDCAVATGQIENRYRARLIVKGLVAIMLDDDATLNRCNAIMARLNGEKNVDSVELVTDSSEIEPADTIAQEESPQDGPQDAIEPVAAVDTPSDAIVSEIDQNGDAAAQEEGQGDDLRSMVMRLAAQVQSLQQSVDQLTVERDQAIAATRSPRRVRSRLMGRAVAYRDTIRKQALDLMIVTKGRTAAIQERDKVLADNASLRIENERLARRCDALESLNGRALDAQEQAKPTIIMPVVRSQPRHDPIAA